MKYFHYLSLIALFSIALINGCSTEEDEGDIVQISPPPQNELQTGKFCLVKKFISMEIVQGIFAHTARNLT